MLFSNADLKKLILPLFLEQLLLMLVGLADIFIISFVGEASVSGVSLVNSFNTIFLFLFTALASGGAVVISQYIGRNEKEMADRASSQLLIISILFSMTCSILILLFNESLMHLMFGQVEDAVMEACVVYLKILAYSYPFIAIYNTGAAVYRSFGNTHTTMVVSIAANLINVAGNLIGIFVLHAGVAGVAYPSLLSYIFSAAVITVLCFSKSNPIQYQIQNILKWNGYMQKRMLSIAIPNGIESGIFQFVKVALSSIVALFGTYQIAANGIAQSIWSVASLSCVAMEPVFITVIGQCMGAQETEQAEFYFKKLMRITLLLSAVWNGLIFLATPILMQFYTLTEETKQLTILLVLIHNLFNAIAYPFADPLGKGLRAAGDVKFTTVISLFTTIGIRLVFSYIFGIGLNMGVIGIAFAMCLDWTIRGIIYWLRLKSNQWKNYQVI